MQRYLEQLIEDLRNAANQAPPDILEDDDLDDEEALEMELEEAERFVSGPFENLSDIVGIPKKLLPSPEKLAETQMKLLIPEIENLLNAYNFYPEYPEGVPDKLLYKAIYEIWDDEYVRMHTGHCHIEFCDYDEEQCPFPGYCDECKNRNAEDQESIPENEFNIKASDLKGDEKNINQDFNQIEKEYYKDSELTDNEGFVPGIHNYCDRWCERCDFTDKCRVFEMEQEMLEMFNKKNADEGKGESLKNIAPDDFDDETMIEPEIEMEFPEDIDDELLEDDDFFSPDKKAGRHPMAELAYNYSMQSLKWFKKHHKELNTHFTTHIAKGYADDVMEASEVMQWYHMFIFVKLKRALTGFYELDNFEDADYDLNGSAKVALIGLDRSIEATTTLMRNMKVHREEIRGFRDQLIQIRLMAEELFPEARSFIRPGLDEL